MIRTRGHEDLREHNGGICDVYAENPVMTR